MNHKKRDILNQEPAEEQAKEKSQRSNKPRDAASSNPQRYKIQFQDPPRNRNNSTKVYQNYSQLTESQVTNALKSSNGETERKESEEFYLQRSLSFHPSHTLLRTISKQDRINESTEEIQNITKLGSMNESPKDEEELQASPGNIKICKGNRRLLDERDREEREKAKDFVYRRKL